MLSLWRDDERCVGVVTDRRAVAARATLLSTGGAAALWERTTNPAGAVGDGMAAAYRAGAALADLEFVQFHPTTLVDSSLLLSEALRGEGAVLLDDQGNRFTDELAPRDVVAREIAARGTVLLDLRAIDRGRFPSLMGSLVERGLRPRTDADPGRAGRALLGRRGPHRSRRPQRAPGSLRRGRVRGDGSARREPPRLELAARVPGLRPPRRACRARRARPPVASPRLPAAPAPEPVTPELRASLWRDCGLIRDAEASSACSTRRTCSPVSSPGARSRARRAAAPTSARTSRPRARSSNATSSFAPAQRRCSRHGGSDRHARAHRPLGARRGHRRRRRDDRGDGACRRRRHGGSAREGAAASSAGSARRGDVPRARPRDPLRGARARRRHGRAACRGRARRRARARASSRASAPR